MLLYNCSVCSQHLFSAGRSTWLPDQAAEAPGLVLGKGKIPFLAAAQQRPATPATINITCKYFVTNDMLESSNHHAESIINDATTQ